MRKVLKGSFALLLIFGLIGFIIYYIWQWYKIPSQIFLEENKNEILFFHAPVTCELYRDKNIKEDGNIPVHAELLNAKKYELNEAVPLTVRRGESYLAELKFFGIFPYKTVEISSGERQYFYPLGDPIGIYIKIDGVMVIDIGSFINDMNEEVAPCKNILEIGDYITAINGVPITKKSEFVECIDDSKGNVISLTVKRDETELTFPLQAQKTSNGEYKLGIWIRDSLQGIGTMTAMTEDGHFMALGHGISDFDTGEVVDLAYGRLYKTSILAITNGKKGEPGELNGVIQYQKENIVGDVTANTEQGISGVLKNTDLFGEKKEPLPIAYKQDVQKGEAWIYSDLEQEGKRYKINITELRYDTVDHKKGIVFDVVDGDLLDYTGGIVQGMSGSPVIQNGRIIGAVTHVLVNDPTRGYGIFIENMLEHDN